MRPVGSEWYLKDQAFYKLIYKNQMIPINEHLILLDFKKMN